MASCAPTMATETWILTHTLRAVAMALLPLWWVYPLAGLSMT